MYFPLFDLKIDISKIAFSIFGLNIYWYAIIIVCAIVIALSLCKKDDGKYGINFNTILDLAVYLLPISIISARLYYIIFNFEVYADNPIKILDFRNGGLAIYGGIIGAIATTYIFCKIKKISFLDILDYIAPYLALGQCIGRWGNFVNIEAYGTETSMPWRMGIWENNMYKEVHPTFLYESISTLLIFVFLFLIRNKRNYSGQITYLYFALYGFFRMLIEGLRIDSLMFQNIRISQILSLAFFVVFGSILLYKKISQIKSTKKHEI